ncbi:hypothetical protein ET445_13650 [Agromyces protaetiae]|uniref:Uncharacterized protein n=1 Tax=Agromyces protaetiae TaxID=2509455 RepID=A0A4P6FGG5_9MICO|nr:hypothetical protein [Agromyces protaetiae]QAY74213.1 hypothetical protein ET445_13650 [Agromyces protaetiae]
MTTTTITRLPILTRIAAAVRIRRPNARTRVEPTRAELAERHALRLEAARLRDAASPSRSFVGRAG